MRPTNLSRSKTTIQVDPNARERIAALRPGSDNGPGGGSAASSPAPLGRSNTMGGPRGMGMGGPGPARALSVKKPQTSPMGAQDAPLPAPPAKSAAGGGRLTEFYDDYIDSYGGEELPPPLPTSGPERVAAWARSNANPNQAPPARAPSSRGPPPSAYAASSYGSGSQGGLRRKVTRRGTMRSRAPSQYMYEEEEEGYVSGDYDDGPFELVKIRVKLHYQDDVRGMALTPETPFDEFIDRVCGKFGKATGGLALKFKDEDGGKVTLRDDSDYELAIETARESAKGKPEGKLEIWCTDI